jgi:hypothetical protein
MKTLLYNSTLLERKEDLASHAFPKQNVHHTYRIRNNILHHMFHPPESPYLLERVSKMRLRLIISIADHCLVVLFEAYYKI